MRAQETGRGIYSRELCTFIAKITPGVYLGSCRNIASDHGKSSGHAVRSWILREPTSYRLGKEAAEIYPIMKMLHWGLGFRGDKWMAWTSTPFPATALKHLLSSHL